MLSSGAAETSGELLVDGASDAAGQGAGRPREVWTANELAFAEVLDLDPNYDNKQSGGISRVEALRLWYQFLEREDIPPEQRAFAWWRLADLHAYHRDPDEDGERDYESAAQGFKNVLSAVPGLVSFETLNVARLLGSLPGTRQERVSRIATVFNWTTALDEQDIRASAQRTFGIAGYVVETRYFRNRQEGSHEERLDSLVSQYDDTREFVSSQVTSFISNSIQFAKEPDDVKALLDSIRLSATDEELELWESMYEKLFLKAGTPIQP